MAEMIAIKNGNGQTIGYQGVKYVDGKPLPNGKQYGVDKKLVSKEDIDTRQRIADARRAKSDTRSAMTESQRRTADMIEKQWKGLNKEKGVIIDANGNIIGEARNGTQNSASFAFNKKVDYSDKVITHYHPSLTDGGHGKTLAQGIGASLSDADVLVASKHNVKAIRAVTDDYVFQISRKGNDWGKINKKELEREYGAVFQNTLTRYTGLRFRGIDVMQAQYNAAQHIGRTSKNEAEAYNRLNRIITTASHRAIQAIADKYDLQYTRSKR